MASTAATYPFALPGGSGELISTYRADAIEAVDLVLRVSVFLCFVGHGLLAVFVNGTNQKWLNYLRVAGFGDVEIARIVMKLIGIVDVVVGVLTILKPELLIVCYWSF